MQPPNLFIVGAPRCGTTSMYRYLQQHPDVFMCAHKAPNYWSTDVFPSGRMSEEAYLALFADAREQPWRGEASVSYLYSQVAARALKAFAPSARIIVMLRNPADMAYSLHQRRVELGNEPFLDFESALAAEAPRQEGRMAGGASGLYRYRAVGAYTDQLARYFDAFGRERVHVILYDDFQRDTRSALQHTLRFLEVREDVPVDLSPVNAGVRIRSPALYRLSSLLWRHRLSAPLGDALHARNKTPAGPRRLPPALRQRLQSAFEPEVARLGALLGRDLSAWSRAEGS